MRFIQGLGVLFAVIWLAVGCGRGPERSSDTSQPPTTAVEERTVTKPAAATEPAVNSGVEISLRVTTPTDGASVSISELVRGSTPYSSNHYIIVIPETTPTVRWVQNGRAIVTNGSWSGSAQFGEGNVGVGEHFLVRCLVTKATLSAGALNVQALPTDAIESEAVKVKRTK